MWILLAGSLRTYKTKKLPLPGFARIFHANRSTDDVAHRASGIGAQGSMARIAEQTFSLCPVLNLSTVIEDNEGCL